MAMVPTDLGDKLWGVVQEYRTKIQIEPVPSTTDTEAYKGIIEGYNKSMWQKIGVTIVEYIQQNGETVEMPGESVKVDPTTHIEISPQHQHKIT